MKRAGIGGYLWPTDQRIHQYLAGEDETWGKVKMNIDADIIDAPVALPTTGTKTYTYNFTPFGVAYTFSQSMNNIGATAKYDGFINGSPSDLGGEIGQILDYWQYTVFGNFYSGNLIYYPNDQGVLNLPDYYDGGAAAIASPPWQV